MKIRELYNPQVLIAITNEEANFLKKFNGAIELSSLSEREQRIAENLIIKDILCKISDTQAMVKENVSH
jgi:hypothetical protein